MTPTVELWLLKVLCCCFIVGADELENISFLLSHLCNSYALIQQHYKPVDLPPAKQHVG